jgi:hypothetical protein
MQATTQSTSNNKSFSVYGDMLKWVKDGMPNSEGVKARFTSTTLTPVDTIKVSNGDVSVLSDGTLAVLDTKPTVKSVPADKPSKASKASKTVLRGKATSQQTFLIKCLGGGDVRDQGLSKKQADELIKALKTTKQPVKEKAKPSTPKVTKTKAKTSKKSPVASDLLKSTATAVRSASKSIGKAASDLDVALDNLEALLKA